MFYRFSLFLRQSAVVHEHLRSPLWLQEHSPLLNLSVEVSSGLPMTWKMRAPETSKYMTLAQWLKVHGVTHLCLTDVNKQQTSSSSCFTTGSRESVWMDVTDEGQELYFISPSSLADKCVGLYGGEKCLSKGAIVVWRSKDFLREAAHQCSHMTQPADNPATGGLQVWFSCFCVC